MELNRRMEKVNQYIVQQIKTADTGQRSHLTSLRARIIELKKEKETAHLIINTIANTIKSSLTVNSIVVNLINTIQSYIRWEKKDDVTNKTKAQAGLIILDWFCQIDLIDVKLRNTIIKNKVKPQWFLTFTSASFSAYGKSIPMVIHSVNPNHGVRYWTKPIIDTPWRQVGIVKKAIRDNMIHHYTKLDIPLVYQALNRLNSQTFTVNRTLLLFAQDEVSPNSFIPNKVDSMEIKLAYKAMTDTVRRALTKEEIQFKEYHKNDSDIYIEREIPRNIQRYIDVSQIEYKKIISKHSKRLEYEEIIKAANLWKDGDINYLYTLDTRGRIYTEQPYFNPLGSDLAKALLLYKESDDISGYDLALHVANCYGYDKAPFEERVQWTMHHSEDIRLIGQNPWVNWETIKKLGLNKEKTLWQGVAASMEWEKLLRYMETHNGEEEGFRSCLPIGLDSTASGTQILTMITKDDSVAPYVNLTKSPDGRVGDFYTYLADDLLKKIKSSDKAKDLNDLQEFIKPEVWAKVKRITAKRNSMTFNYSGTRYGFGLQHLSDKSEYGKITQTESHGDKLSNKSCFLLGSLMYDTCLDKIRGSAEMMQYLRDCADTVSNKNIITWRLPDNFLAYQKYSKKSSHSSACGLVGNTKVNLKMEFYSDTGDGYEHRNAIAANFTHSLDSYLLRLIVNAMPHNAPLSTVHDQFSTSSKYILELHNIARRCYQKLADRDTIQFICDKAFNLDRELPIVGTWDSEELNDAEFFIC